MKAVILAGGLGTRLRPAVGDLPKAMAPIAERPFLGYQLALLRCQGVVDIVLAVGYGWKTIEDYFGSGDGLGVRLTYSVEAAPLGTAGAVRQAATLFDDESFLVLNGDTFFDAPLDRLAGTPAGASSLATIAVVVVPEIARFGGMVVDEMGRVLSFVEKGSQGRGCINAGVYLLRRAVLDRIPAGRATSLEHEVFPGLIPDRQLSGCLLEGFHLDIGTPDSFAQAQRDLPGRISW